jgi:hypothetical protein
LCCDGKYSKDLTFKFRNAAIAKIAMSGKPFPAYDAER